MNTAACNQASVHGEDGRSGRTRWPRWPIAVLGLSLAGHVAGQDLRTQCGVATKTHVETGALYQSAEAAHTFHDARHTFAAWMYHAERAGGNAEPWKIVQARLGHRQLATTLNTYLRVVDDYRTEVNLNVYRFLREKFGN